jgi:hypothetical protein
MNKWAASPKTRLDYEQICCALFKELEGLEVKTGIAEKADNARSGPLLPLYYGSDAPLFSERRKTENRDGKLRMRKNVNTSGTTCDGQFGLYIFSVPDLDLRKQLIQKERELTDNERYSFMTDVLTAEAELRQAKATGKNWHWWVYLGAIGFVALGWSLFQLPELWWVLW